MRPVGQSQYTPRPFETPLGRGPEGSVVRFGSPLPSLEATSGAKNTGRSMFLHWVEGWLEARGVKKVKRFISDLILERYEYSKSKKENRISKAIKLLDLAILLKESRLGQNDDEVLALYLQVGNLLKRADRKYDAHYYLDTAWQRQIENLKGQKCPNLAELLTCQGDFYHSLRYHHSEMIAHPRTEMAKPLLADKSQRAIKAEMLYRKALGVWRYLAENDPENYDALAEAKIYSNWGGVALENKAPEQAEGLLEKAFFMLREQEGDLANRERSQVVKSLYQLYRSKYGQEHSKTLSLHAFIWGGGTI